MTQELLGRVHRELIDVLNSINQDKIHHDGDYFHELLHDVEKALQEHAMRETQRLGQEIEQEPVAYFHPHKGFYWAKPTSISAPTIADVEPLPLYTHPPQRTWVDVPDEEIKRLWIQYRAALPRYLCFAKDLLSRSKEKNT